MFLRESSATVGCGLVRPVDPIVVVRSVPG
jgi:hypothetical protein